MPPKNAKKKLQQKKVIKVIKFWKRCTKPKTGIKVLNPKYHKVRIYIRKLGYLTIFLKFIRFLLYFINESFDESF